MSVAGLQRRPLVLARDALDPEAICPDDRVLETAMSKLGEAKMRQQSHQVAAPLKARQHAGAWWAVVPQKYLPSN